MKHLLAAAKAEIERLRRRNEILEAKVSTMELMGALLHSQPNYQPEGAVVDVAWELGREIENIEEAEKQSTPTEP